MRDLTNAFALGIASFTLLIGIGCSQAPDGTGGAAVDVDSPEFAAMQYRQGLMRVIASKAGTLRDMADGNIDVDDDIFREYSSDLVALAGMIVEGFVPGSDSESIPGSNALPDAWQNLDDIRERAAGLQASAQNVADLAASGGFAAGQTAASEEIGPNCGGCHRNYRQRDE